MKSRPKKAPTNWRLMWYQVVEGARRLKWHTGSRYECEVLQRVCIAAGEWHQLNEPGSFVE